MSHQTNLPLKSTTIGFLALLWVLRTKTALAVGDVVVETVVEIGVVKSGAVVVSTQLNSSHGQPPAQFCLIKMIPRRFQRFLYVAGTLWINAYLTGAVKLSFFKFGHAIVLAITVAITSIYTAPQDHSIWVNTAVPFFVSFFTLKKCYISFKHRSSHRSVFLVIWYYLPHIDRLDFDSLYILPSTTVRRDRLKIIDDITNSFSCKTPL